MATKKPSIRSDFTMRDFLAAGYRVSQPEPEVTTEAPEEPKSRSAFAVANDLVIEGANAVAGGVSSAANAIRSGNAVSEWIQENIIKEGEKNQSDTAKASKERFRQEVDAAEGIGGELAAVGRYVTDAPLLTMAQALGSFVVPGAAVKGVQGVAKIAGAAGNGLTRAGMAGGAGAGAMLAGGDAAGTAYELSRNAGATDEEALAAGRQATVIPAMVGAAGGLVGAERLFAGGKGFAGGTASRAFKTGAVEAGQEGVEEGVTAYEGRRAAMPFDASIDPMKGVAAAAGMGAAMGGVTGAGVSLISPADQIRAQNLVPESGPSSRAANAGTEARAQAAEQTGVDPMQPAQDMVDDPIAARINQIPDEKERTEAAKAYAVLGKQGVAKGIVQTNQKLFDRLMAKHGLDGEQDGAPDPAAAYTPPGAIMADPMAGQAELLPAASPQPDPVVNESLTAAYQLPDAGNMVPPGVDPATGELIQPAQPVPLDFTGKTDEELTQARQNAQDPTIRKALATELQTRRKAAEGQEQPQIQPTDILNPSGQPFIEKRAADLAAKKTPGEVVAVPGGFVVRPEVQAAAPITQSMPETPSAPEAVEPVSQPAPAMGTEEGAGVSPPPYAVGDVLKSGALSIQVTDVSPFNPLFGGNHQVGFEVIANDGPVQKAYKVGSKTTVTANTLERWEKQTPQAAPAPNPNDPEDYKGHLIYASDMANGQFFVRKRVGKKGLGDPVGKVYATKELARAAVDGLDGPAQAAVEQPTAETRWTQATPAERVEIAKAGGIALKPAENVARADWSAQAPKVQEKLAKGLEARPAEAAKSQGMHYASGIAAFKKGEPRKLPSYFTSDKGKNPKDWFAGWDVASAADVSTNPQKVDMSGERVQKTAKSDQVGFSDLEKALQAKSRDTEADGDVAIVAGSGQIRHVSLGDAAQTVQQAIDAGVQPVPFQIHNATGIRLGDVDGVLKRLKERAPAEQQPASVGDAISGQMDKQVKRVARLRREAEAEGRSLEKKKQAQAKVQAAEADLRKMRLNVFEVEDAAAKAVESGDPADFAEHAGLFPDVAAIIKPPAGQAKPDEMKSAGKQAKPAAPKRPQGGSTLRKSAYQKNPLLTLLATKGLFHDKEKPGSLKTEFSPDRQIMVSGYGPVFKKSGLQVDALLVYAVEDGYLRPDASEQDLYDLIQRAVAGEKISPTFSEQGLSNMEADFAAEMQSRYEERPDDMSDQDWYGQDEAGYADALVAEVASLSDAEAQRLDEDVEDLWDAPASSMSTRAAMEAMGFTEQEIQDEERRDTEKADEVAAREAGRGVGKDQAAAQAEQGPGAEGRTEGLTTPTQAEMLADDGIEIRQGKGFIKGKFLADVDGDGVPGGPWETEGQARQAAEAWKQTVAERQTQSTVERARRDSIAEKFRSGGEVTNAEIESLGLKLGSSDVRWFFPTAANLFGLSSRAIRPIVGGLIRTGTTDMGVQREYAPTRQALQAIAKTQADSPLTSPTQADVLAQQDRQDSAEALDQRAQVDREASGFALQAQTQDNRADNTGDMFGGPSVDDFQQAAKRNAKPGTANTGPDLFDGAQEGAAQSDSQAFIPAPDGGLDYGEITPEMGKAMRRQAGKIRLRQGSDAWGLKHIEARHGEQFKSLGFESTSDFIAQVASGFNAIYAGRGAGLSMVLETGRTGGRLMVQLEPSAEGDFYDVKTASPIRAEQYKNEKPLWRRAGTSAPTAQGSSLLPGDQNGNESVAQPDPAAQEPEAPKLTQAEAEKLMEWQDLGQTNGVKTHILTFYESQADKDAKRGRMTVATVTQGDRSAIAWMVDGDDQTFGPLSLAKKRGMEVGMAKVVADGFVDGGAAMFSRGTSYDRAQQKEMAGREKVGRAAMGRISKDGVTSPDDLRDMLRVPGYSQWAQSAVAGDVDAAKALRDELSKEYGNTNWKAPKLNDQGIITFYPDWPGRTDASIEKLTALADKYDAPIAVRGGALYPRSPVETQLSSFGFERYNGMQEPGGRPNNVLFGMIRPAGGITATTPLFSKGNTSATGVTQEVAQEVIDAITARWANAPEVVVVQDMTDPRIPEAVRTADAKQRSQGASGEPEGFWHGGKAYVVAGALRSPGAVMRVLFHEVLGHSGLRGVFGDKLKPILMQLASLRRGEIVAKAREYGLVRKGKDGNPAVDVETATFDQMWAAMDESHKLEAAEEVLAEMAQSKPEIGFVQRVIAVIRGFLRDMVPGFDKLALTDEDIVGQFILPARAYVERGRGGARGGVSFSRNQIDAQDGVKFATMETYGNKPSSSEQASVKRLGAFVARALNVAEPDANGAYSAVSLPEGSDLRTVAAAFGKEAVGYRLAGVLKGKKSPFSTIGGVSTAAIPGTVFINISGDRPHLSVLGHELAHEMRRDNPELFAELVDAVRPFINQQTYKAEFGKERVAVDLAKKGNVDAVREEFIGEVLSDGFTEPGFWNALGEKSPTLLSKVVGALGNLIDKARKTFGPQRRTAKYLTDFDRVMQIAGEAMAKYADAKTLPAQNGGDADIRFSRSSLTAGGLASSMRQFDVKGKTGNALAHYRGMGMQALGRRQIVDLFSAELPQLKQYDELVQSMEAEKNDNAAEADGLVREWADLDTLTKKPGEEKRLAELMHDATLAQIDPAKDYQPGDNRGQWASLRNKFNALSPNAQALYTKARDMYAGHYDQVQQAVQDRIERSEMSGSQKKAMIARMNEDFFTKTKGVYFPLARFGKYVMVVKDAEGQVVNVSRAETLNEAEATRKELLRNFDRAQGYAVGKVLKDAEFNPGRDAVGTGFMADLFGMLDKQGVDDALRDSVSQLYLASLPDLSWAKHGIHRKGTPGFSQDARRAFAQNMFHGARYLAKLRYSDRLQSELTAMQDHIEAYESIEEYDSVKAQQVVDEMVKRHESLMNPKTNPISTALTSVGFVFYLGVSPAAAMVNLSQTALVAYPFMGAKWGFGKASAALLKASKETVQAKNDISKVLKGDELAAYEQAVRDGTIDVTMAHDLAGVAQGEDAKVAWAMQPVMRWASFLFHHAERFNRQATFVAAFRLAKETGVDNKTAFEEAKKATYDGHFDYGAANRPRLMQGNWAKVLLLFKQYGQNMVYTMSRQAYLAMKGLTPAERQEARKVLGGILAGHAMAAGALGLPLIGPLLAAASFLGGDEDEPWDAEVALKNAMADSMGPKAAEVLSHGLSRLTPWDISSRVALNQLILPDVQEGLEGQKWAEKVMVTAFGPIGGIFTGAAKGLQSMSEGKYGRGLEEMLPVALRNPIKALRYQEEGAIDKTGVVIKDEVSMAGVLGQASGFAPSEVRLATEGRSAIYQQDRARMERRKVLMTQFAQARMAGDDEGANEVRQAIAKFNEKNPKMRITPAGLALSIRNRQRRINEAEQGVYLPKSRRDAVEAGRFALTE